MFGKTEQPKCLEVSDPPLDMGLVLFDLLVFPKVFRKHKKHLREHQTYKIKPKKPKQTSGKPTQNNCLGVSDAPLNMGLVLFVFVGFPEGF